MQNEWHENEPAIGDALTWVYTGDHQPISYQIDFGRILAQLEVILEADSEPTPDYSRITRECSA